MLKKKKEEKLDVANLNDVIGISKQILKIVYILVAIIALYIIIKVCKELNLKATMIMFLKTVSPLFIGFFIAWLFDPFVKYLKKKGFKRSVGTVITYIILLIAIGLILGTMIPLISNQINEFVKIIPSIFETIKTWINEVFDKLNNIDGLDALSVKNNIFNKMEIFGNELTNNLPETLVKIVKSLVSGIGTFGIGLIIGFYLLMSFDNASELVITWLPKRYRKDGRELFNEVNTSLRRFIKGAFWDSTLVFVVTTIGFMIVGLKAPVLFGLFCGLTNVIPYAGPYIGGIPAVIVGFSGGIWTGIFTLLVVVVVQMLEGNLLQPLIMSKTTKLHPVTIIIGLLVFGYFFGIIGMAIATPVISALKTIFVFFSEKYEWFNEE